jgi:hypothetical protein
MLPHRIVASVVRAEVNECRFNAVVSIDVHEIRYESKPKILALLLLLLPPFQRLGGIGFSTAKMPLRARNTLGRGRFRPTAIFEFDDKPTITMGMNEQPTESACYAALADVIRT